MSFDRSLFEPLMPDSQLLDWTHRSGLTVVSSVRTRRNYLIPLALAEDAPAFDFYIRTSDEPGS